MHEIFADNIQNISVFHTISTDNIFFYISVTNIALLYPLFLV